MYIQQATGNNYATTLQPHDNSSTMARTKHSRTNKNGNKNAHDKKLQRGLASAARSVAKAYGDGINMNDDMVAMIVKDVKVQLSSALKEAIVTHGKPSDKATDEASTNDIVAVVVDDSDAGVDDASAKRNFKNLIEGRVVFKSAPPLVEDESELENDVFKPENDVPEPT